MSSVENRRIQEYTYSWTLDEFYRSLAYGFPLTTTVTYVSSKNWIKFRLESKDLKQMQGNISVSIDKSDDLDIALGDCDLNSSKNGSSSPAFSRRRCSTLPGWLFSWDSYFPEEFKQGSVNITCYLFLGETSTSSSCDDIHLMKLSFDISQLLESDEFSDLTLQDNVEDSTSQSFKVHKAILASRTPELAKLLRLESDSEPIKVVDVTTSNVLKTLIRFWYTGKLDVNLDEIPFGLHHAMQILKLDDIKGKLCVYPNHVASVTRINTTCHEFSWPIKNFTKLLPESNLSSPVLYQSRFSVLQLKLQIKTTKVFNQDVVKIYISRMPTYQESTCRLIFKISALNIFGDFVKERTFETDSTEDWHAAIVFNTSELNDLLWKDTFTLHMRIDIQQTNNEINDSSYSSKSVEHHIISCKDLDNLSTSLENLFNSKKFSDFKITARGRQFPVHKCILKHRSPRFFDLLTKTSDSFAVTNSSKLDMDPNTLHKMLLYIYTGKVEIIDCGSATKLYLAAFKNDMNLLKDKCLSFIKENMTF